MKTHNRSNALLVELMIVILFFMLSATILLQVFAASTNQSRNADITTRALTGAQNTADRLYAAPDAQKALGDMGFERKGDIWTLTGDGYVLSVSAQSETLAAGTMLRYTVDACIGDDKLFTLPVSRYVEAQP